MIQKQVMIVTFAIIALLLVSAALLVGVMLFVRGVRHYCIGKLEYRRYFSQEGAFVGDEIYFVEEIVNHSFFPMLLVDLETHIPSAIKMEGCRSKDAITQCFVSRFVILPCTKIKRIHPVVCQKRGYYQLESAKLLFSGIEIYLESYAKFSIYPKELSIKETARMNDLLDDSARSLQPLMEDAFSFSGVRAYMTGDSFAMINQKQSAKHGQWMVNRRDYLMGRQICVCVNFQPNEMAQISQKENDKLYEIELSIAAWLLGEAVRSGSRAMLCSNGRDAYGRPYYKGSFFSGDAYYREALKQLSACNGRYGISMAALLDMVAKEPMQGTEIFLLTSYTDEVLRERAGMFECMGNAVTIVNVFDWQVNR